MKALLLRRIGPEGEEAHKELWEQLESVDIIHSLTEVIEQVKQR